MGAARQTVEPIDERWRRRAACRGMDTEMFYPRIRDTPGGVITPAARKQIAEAVAVCDSCPVKVECYLHAVHFDERYGIWGGKLFAKAGGTTQYGLGHITHG